MTWHCSALIGLICYDDLIESIEGESTFTRMMELENWIVFVGCLNNNLLYKQGMVDYTRVMNRLVHWLILISDHWKPIILSSVGNWIDGDESVFTWVILLRICFVGFVRIRMLWISICRDEVLWSRWTDFANESIHPLNLWTRYYGRCTVK